jgi:NADPH-dependent curcumin reductase CurA
MASAWHLKSRPTGTPELDNFDLKRVDLPGLERGQIHVRNILLSVDPYMRPRMDDNPRSYVPSFKLGEPMDGGAIGQVISSKAPGFEPGDLVRHMQGWRDEAVLSAISATLINPAKHVPVEAYLGILGGPGLTAYFGLFDVAAAKAGDTVFVSGAAGAVGSTVVQLAKARGFHIIASAGGQHKCDWLRELGADAVVDYKSRGNLIDKLRAAAPNGIDVYFDNVGGDHLDAALATANDYARFALCGMVGNYNDTGKPACLHHLTQTVMSRLTLRGFISSDFSSRRLESDNYIEKLVTVGIVKVKSTIVEGLGAMPAALLGLFGGDNVGKMLVRL